MKAEIVEKDTRFYNWVVDVLVILVITYIITSLSRGFTDLYYERPYKALVFQGVYYIYYFTMELSFNKTLGKMVTKSEVVHKSGKKPTVINYVIRTVFRIATLDVISFALGTKVGMHDLMSNTRVVKQVI